MDRRVQWSVGFEHNGEADGSRRGEVGSLSSLWVRVSCSIRVRFMWVRGVVRRWGARYIGG